MKLIVNNTPLTGKEVWSFNMTPDEAIMISAAISSSVLGVETAMKLSTVTMLPIDKFNSTMELLQTKSDKDSKNKVSWFTFPRLVMTEFKRKSESKEDFELFCKGNGVDEAEMNAMKQGGVQGF